MTWSSSLTSSDKTCGQSMNPIVVFQSHCRRTLGPFLLLRVQCLKLNLNMTSCKCRHWISNAVSGLDGGFPRSCSTTALVLPIYKPQTVAAWDASEICLGLGEVVAVSCGMELDSPRICRAAGLRPCAAAPAWQESQIHCVHSLGRERPATLDG
jgi:hypothetical protein